MIQHPSRFKIQEKRQITAMTLIGFNMYRFSGQRFWEELAAYFDVEKVQSLRSECVVNIEGFCKANRLYMLSLIHISEPTRPLYISYAVFCLKKKKKRQKTNLTQY
eukprot:TRINITY_DN12913_c0_g1_i2.p1 TRINITY_DN12913_c0_g1~~TRINITY_DN12913_c0_g1_i2.p1  ORF type:complete len:106 (-),score=20.71 TRINITY_DN12913_c0_g1_i2:51-368(-)